MSGLALTMLIEDCVSKILSLTSPADVCRSSLASSALRSAADSDVVWERILPYDYRNIVARATIPLQFSSKKDLFFQLCNPTLLDEGKKSFMLEKFSGKKSYMLSARELDIAMSHEPMNWSWTSMPRSRFSEVAVLKTIQQLEIQGKIETQILSPDTTYGAYLIMKISEHSYGLDSIPLELSIQVGNNPVCGSTAYLRHGDSNKRQLERLFYANRVEMMRQRVNAGEGRVPRERKDGWMEIEVGDFFSGCGDEEVKMSVVEVKGGHFKGGLIVEGIELRPKH
ncbi:F-box protein like [Actinidia chinensis var. chinensis]|uniref:F-box protein like n=1 Tax=Actinidia chinensis var. chinensis TaxID=1590841 RepID=A0A2R6RFN2_ACTCC|nr:F-box protein like [Actinidia chinensis var. chinensis]